MLPTFIRSGQPVAEGRSDVCYAKVVSTTNRREHAPLSPVLLSHEPAPGVEYRQKIAAMDAREIPFGTRNRLLARLVPMQPDSVEH